MAKMKMDEPSKPLKKRGLKPKILPNMPANERINGAPLPIKPKSQGAESFKRGLHPKTKGVATEIPAKPQTASNPIQAMWKGAVAGTVGLAPELLAKTTRFGRRGTSNKGR
jgi:hypothetical protein